MTRSAEEAYFDPTPVSTVDFEAHLTCEHTFWLGVLEAVEKCFGIHEALEVFYIIGMNEFFECILVKIGIGPRERGACRFIVYLGKDTIAVVWQVDFDKPIGRRCVKPLDDGRNAADNFEHVEETRFHCNAPMLRMCDDCA